LTGRLGDSFDISVSIVSRNIRRRDARRAEGRRRGDAPRFPLETESFER
jgi:hypothetical protein